MPNPTRSPWIRALGILLMLMGGWYLLAIAGMLINATWSGGLRMGDLGIPLVTLLTGVGFVWLGWVLWNGTAPLGHTLQPATRRYLGNGLIAVGLLMAVLAGGCTLIAGGVMVAPLLTNPGQGNVVEALAMGGIAIVTGGPFIAMGLGLFALGRHLKGIPINAPES
ncbi:MAG: hypothetical protein OEY97_11005 [Nitrospirota bacterium]|nr:hypothetical protein [Nitrospirota bacterium]